MQDSGQARPYSSQEYLQKLRQERLQRQQATGSALPASSPNVPDSVVPPITTVDPTPAVYQAPAPKTAPPTSFNQAPMAPDPSPAPSDHPPMTDAEMEAERQRRSAFQESQLFPGQFVPVPEETILEWAAPSRPFKKRNRQFYTTVAIITGLISLILFFAGQFLPIAVVIAVAFLAYVMSTVPPEQVTNKISTWGIRNDDKLYYWEELGRFWFDNKYSQSILQIETARFPGRLTLLLGAQNEDDLKQLLSEVLLNEKPKESVYDKVAKWLQDKIPLDAD